MSKREIFISKAWSTFVAVGFAAILIEMACTARETAKDAYTAQSEACVSIYSGDASAQRSCLDYVRAKWTKAGAPAAATDGGAE